MRLNLFLSRCGFGSRRKCDDLITEKHIRINGEIIDTPGYRVKEDDNVTFDNNPVQMDDENIYIALNKPVNYLSANSDDRGRACTLDLLGPYKQKRLFHVGRLDYRSSGLLLYTNDGVFADFITHPSNGVEKEYFVETVDIIPEGFLKEFRRGIVIDGTPYSLMDYTLKTSRKAHLVLVEGKKREIRTVFVYRKIRIKRLHRFRIGIVTLEGMKAGEHRILKKTEINWFLDKMRKKR